MKIALLALLLGSAAAQPPAGSAPPERLAAQREAMKALDFMDGA